MFCRYAALCACVTSELYLKKLPIDVFDKNRYAIAPFIEFEARSSRDSSLFYGCLDASLSFDERSGRWHMRGKDEERSFEDEERSKAVDQRA